MLWWLPGGPTQIHHQRTIADSLCSLNAVSSCSTVTLWSMYHCPITVRIWRRLPAGLLSTQSAVMAAAGSRNTPLSAVSITSPYWNTPQHTPHFAVSWLQTMGLTHRRRLAWYPDESWSSAEDTCLSSEPNMKLVNSLKRESKLLSVGRAGGGWDNPPTPRQDIKKGQTLWHGSLLCVVPSAYREPYNNNMHWLLIICSMYADTTTTCRCKCIYIFTLVHISVYMYWTFTWSEFNACYFYSYRCFMFIRMLFFFFNFWLSYSVAAITPEFPSSIKVPLIL